MNVDNTDHMNVLRKGFNSVIIIRMLDMWKVSTTNNDYVSVQPLIRWYPSQNPYGCLTAR
jgi:hypothetical protein